MGKPKRHHFVPRVLLKRFVDNNGWLHYFSKLESPPRVRPSRIEKVFREGHLYSEISLDGQIDPAVEHELGQIEAIIDPILKKFVEAAESDRLPGLTPFERLAWDFFFVVQWRRVPDLKNTVATDSEAHIMHSEILEDMRRRYPSRIHEIEKLAEPSVAKNLIRNSRVRGVAEVSQRVMDAMASRGVALLRIDAANKALVVGSRPVVQLAFKDGLSLMDEPTEMWLPISSKLAIGVGKRNTPETLYYLRDHSAIRHLNIAIARQSSAFASHSAHLTASIAKAA